MLETAHIADWPKDVDNRGNPKNVICMCKMHHLLFQLHELEISEDFTVHFSPQFQKQCNISKMCKAIRELTPPKIRLPYHERYYPDPELLRNHKFCNL